MSLFQKMNSSKMAVAIAMFFFMIYSCNSATAADPAAPAPPYTTIHHFVMEASYVNRGAPILNPQQSSLFCGSVLATLNLSPPVGTSFACSVSKNMMYGSSTRMEIYIGVATMSPEWIKASNEFVVKMFNNVPAQNFFLTYLNSWSGLAKAVGNTFKGVKMITK